MLSSTTDYIKAGRCGWVLHCRWRYQQSVVLFFFPPPISLPYVGPPFAGRLLPPPCVLFFFSFRQLPVDVTRSQCPAGGDFIIQPATRQVARFFFLLLSKLDLFDYLLCYRVILSPHTKKRIVVLTHIRDLRDHFYFINCCWKDKRRCGDWAAPLSSPVRFLTISLFNLILFNFEKNLVQILFWINSKFKWFDWKSSDFVVGECWRWMDTIGSACGAWKPGNQLGQEWQHRW